MENEEENEEEFSQMNREREREREKKNRVFSIQMMMRNIFFCRTKALQKSIEKKSIYAFFIVDFESTSISDAVNITTSSFLFFAFLNSNRTYIPALLVVEGKIRFKQWTVHWVSTVRTLIRVQLAVTALQSMWRIRGTPHLLGVLAIVKKKEAKIEPVSMKTTPRLKTIVRVNQKVTLSWYKFVS